MRIEKKFDADRFNNLLMNLNFSSVHLSNKQMHINIPNITIYDQFLHQSGFKDLISGSPVKRQHKICMMDIIYYIKDTVNENEKSEITILFQQKISTFKKYLSTDNSEQIFYFFEKKKKITSDSRDTKILYFSLKNIYETLKSRGILCIAPILMATAAIFIHKQNSDTDKNIL